MIGPPPGFAVLCDAAGTVLELLGSAAARYGIAVGAGFPQGMEAASRDKAALLFASLQLKPAIQGWEINGVLDGYWVVPVRCSALVVEAGVLILAVPAESGPGGGRHQEASAAGQPLHPPFGWESLCNELSRLNNDLATAQRELMQQKLEMDHLNTLKNHFIGFAAHDLRSPIQAIRLYAEVLRTRFADRLGTEGRGILSRIEQSALFMAELIKNFLDISLIESGRLELAPAPTDLNAFVARHLEHQRPLAGQKQVQLAFTAHEPLPPVALDPVRFGQVLNNLIDNAVRFSPPGGTVDIATAPGIGQIELTVGDQGPGIPADEIPGLFTPFGPTRSGRAAKKSGTGLGLAIAARLVQAHGGTIAVESRAGHGSTFIIRLPVDRNRSHPLYE